MPGAVWTQCVDLDLGARTATLETCFAHCTAVMCVVVGVYVLCVSEGKDVVRGRDENYHPQVPPQTKFESRVAVVDTIRS